MSALAIEAESPQDTEQSGVTEDLKRKARRPLGVNKRLIKKIGRNAQK